jgi:DNA-binding NtrC family response regulator
MRRTLRRLLRARFQVSDATSCEAALALLEQEADAIDLLLLDIQFPADTMQGLEAVSIICSRWPRLPVVMVSVYHDVGLALHFGALGVRDYLAKEDNLYARLLPAVQRALAPAPVPPSPEMPPIRPFEEIRKASFLGAWHRCSGNMSAAARELGVPYDAFRDALIAWGAVRPRTRHG